jgi:hypothetical protein
MENSENKPQEEKFIYTLKCSPVDTMYATFHLKYAFDDLENLDKLLTTPNEIVKNSTFKKTGDLSYIEVPDDKTRWNKLRVSVEKYVLK